MEEKKRYKFLVDEIYVEAIRKFIKDLRDEKKPIKPHKPSRKELAIEKYKEWLELYNKGMTLQEIADKYGIAQPGISRGFKVLRDNGIIIDNDKRYKKN